MTSTLELVDQDFRRGASACRAPPTRFYLNLTNRCQLRCRHCITHAPQNTRAGPGGDMTGEVVAALTPHLAHASYVGFVHAGEPLIAPALPAVLQAVRAQRGAQPTIVHLLTNGLALTAARFAELVERGVSSWSISIDGMSAASHDALRIGSRVEALLALIRDLSAMRGRRYPGSRLGLAWTMTRSNLHEVEALVRFAAEAKVSWVKLEELHATDATVATEQVTPAALAQAVGRATALAGELGLRLLDHTRDLVEWRCRDDGRGALDDFVNRVDLNACRAPYELVCVEPNGDVRPVSFHYPVAGNLLTEDLATIWRSEPFARAREVARVKRACGGGPTTCAADRGPAHW